MIILFSLIAMFSDIDDVVSSDFVSWLADNFSDDKDVGLGKILEN